MPALALIRHWKLVLGGLALWTAWLALVNAKAIGLNFLLSVLCLVWAADIAAYFGGRAFGRRKLAPSISPGKTWSGLVGGMCFSAVASAACGLAFNAGATPMLAVTGIAIAAVAQGGDLLESAAKRRAGVKDSGNIIPGHGGILDRIDGLIAALVFIAIVRLATAGDWPWA